MDVASMRLVDRWLGSALCFMLTVLRTVTGGQKTPAESGVRRILFIKLAEQGSTVLAYPALRRAAVRVGRENVYVLVFDDNRFILDALGVIPEANVIAISTRGMWGTLTGALGAVRRLWALRIDAAIDLEFFARSTATLAYLSGARMRVGFHPYAGGASYRGNLMTHRLVYNPYLATGQLFEMMVQALDEPAGRFPACALTPPPVERTLPVFTASAGEIEAVRSMLCEVTQCREVPPLLLLNANCSDLLPLRKWQDANYVELASRVLARYPEVVIAFTGARAEAEAVAPLVRQVGSPRCVSLAGRTTLRQLLIAYSLAEVMVTNDSGPAHFAGLTPMDVVVLFGPETPLLFASPSPRSHVLWANTVCSPCVSASNNRRSLCRNNLCMQAITVDQVFGKVAEIYERRRRQAV